MFSLPLSFRADCLLSTSRMVFHFFKPMLKCFCFGQEWRCTYGADDGWCAVSREWGEKRWAKLWRKAIDEERSDTGRQKGKKCCAEVWRNVMINNEAISDGKKNSSGDDDVQWNDGSSFSIRKFQKYGKAYIKYERRQAMSRRKRGWFLFYSF